MYINRCIIILLSGIVLFNNCNMPQSANESIGYTDNYIKYLDGNIRSFDIINDTLFVASEDEGLWVYAIIKKDGRITLDSLSFSNEVGRPVELDIATKSRSLIVLDDYNHTYIGKLDFFNRDNLFLSSITCDDYQRKSTFIDYAEKPIELITPFRHKPTQNEVDPLAWDTSFLHRIKFSEDTYNFDIYSGDCSDTLYKYLNYEIEDVYYNNEKLYLVNPEESKNSITVLSHDLFEDKFSPIDTLLFPARPLSIKSNENYIFVGLDNSEGCYIKLLDSDNLNISNLTIAKGYDIQDIQISNGHIALSAGYKGALVYNVNMEFILLLKGIYAYKTIMYDDFNMIVGTKDGLHIYEIER